MVSINPTPLAGEADIIQQALDNATTLQSSEVILPNTSVSVHYTYTLSLQVTNWLGQSKSAQVAVTKRATAVPHVAISGPSLVQIYRNVPLTLQGVVTPSACAGDSSIMSVQYSWSASPSVSLDPTSKYPPHYWTHFYPFLRWRHVETAAHTKIRGAIFRSSFGPFLVFSIYDAEISAKFLLCPVPTFLTKRNFCRISAS